MASNICIRLLTTITRYESHQVQDRAHDTILKKIERDPEWFLTLLRDAISSFSQEVYQKYYDAGKMKKDEICKRG